MSLLQRAWELRSSFDLDRCRKLVATLARELPPENAELIALQASLARADGDPERALALLARVKAPTFQVFLQKGLTFFGGGDYPSALDEFVAARKAAGPDLEKAAADINALFCLDNLGVAIEEPRARLEASLAKLPETDWGIRAAADCFDLRMAFRRGEIDALRRLRPIGTQAFYFQLWVAELPFTSLYLQFRGQLERFALSAEPLYCKSYRFRTLQGVSYAPDLAQFSIKEAADRIYLWTWRWMQSPNESSLAPIWQTIEHARLAENFTRLTGEDYRLIRNAFAWIGLAHPRQARDWEAWLRRLRPQQLGEFPLLDYEYRLIRACARGETLEDASSPVGDTLRDVVSRRQQRQGTARLRADLNRGFLESGDHRTVSEALARGLALLRQEEVVPMARFAAHCFGFSRYSPDAHEARIHNLLSRLRQSLAQARIAVRVGIRDGNVYGAGDWRGLEIVEDDAPSPPIPRRPVKANGSVKPALIRQRLHDRPHFCRADIERASGISKSAAHRVLQRWLKQGRVVAEGRGRALRYRWKIDSIHSSQ